MADTVSSIPLVDIFETLIERMPYGFAYHKIIVDENNKPIDYIFLEINKKFEEFTGLIREKVINQKATIVIPGIEKVTPDIISLYGKAALTGEATEVELYFDSLKRWHRIYVFSPQKDYFITIFQDISMEKQIQMQSQVAVRALRAISSCNQVIIHATEENELLQGVCKTIVETTGYRLVWIGYAKQNAEKSIVPMAFAGYEDDYLKNIHISWADDEFGQGPSGTAIRTNKSAVMQDLVNNPTFKPWKEEALKRGYASSVCFPLKADGTIGCICMYSGNANAFNDPEVTLLSELSSDLSYGIAALRTKVKEKDSQDKIIKAKDQLQTILQSISDGFFTLNKDFRYTYINDQAAVMVGKNNAKDLQGKLLFEEFPQAIGTAYDKMYHDAMQNRKVIHFDEYFEPFKKWYQGTVYPYSDGISVFFQDITEQKKMQEELKKMSTYNRNLIEVSLDPLVTIGADGKITDVNSATEVVTGLSRKELIGTNFLNYFTDPKKAEEGYQLVFKQGVVRDYPLDIKRKDGNITPVLYNASTYKDEKGNVEGVFAAARDISQLEKIKTALTQTEERYKTYVENSNDVMYAVDTKGIVQYLSPQARRFGLDPESVVNKKTFEDLLPEKTRNQVMQEYQKILTTQQQGFITLEYIDPDGRKFWLEASGRILFDKQNMPVGSIGIMRDVTERKLAADRLKELDTIKSRFIRVVSHQLRTPLAAIRWQLESLLSEHDHLSELQKQLIRESHRADLEIIDTINDLITALDIEEGREVRLDKSETSFVSLWESVEIEYQEKCKVKNIACALTKPPTIMPLVYIDTEKIRTALEKIADNALTYTKDTGQIFVTISQTETSIHFEIKDTGIGIPKDEQPYIFSRFYRASNASNMKPDASGLGLYIAKYFIESHGGKIGFTSEEGKGSTFWFDIPIK